jgi:hypothetical protein
MDIHEQKGTAVSNAQLHATMQLTTTSTPGRKPNWQFLPTIMYPPSVQLYT